MAKKAKIAVKKIDTESKSISFHFSDGYKLGIRLEDLSPEIRDMLALHGLSQKIGDSYAGSKEAVEQGFASSELVFAKSEAERVVVNLTAGLWAVRESGPSRLAQAIAEALGRDISEIVEKLNEWKAGGDEGKKNLKAVRANPKVKAVLARLDREALERKEAGLEAAAGDADTEDVEDLFS